MSFRRDTSRLAGWRGSTIAVVICLATALAGCGTTARPRPHRSNPAATFPNTAANIHLGLAFDYHVANSRILSRNVDYIFGGYFADWNTGIDPPAGHIDSYLPLDVDGYPQNIPGHSLRWWKAHHPDWIVYRCDRRTPAYYGSGNTNVPLDFTNPSVRAYQLQEAATTLEARASGIAFDDFSFTNASDRCGVYHHGAWILLHYPGRLQTNATLADDMLHWLQSMRQQIHQRFPGKSLGVNLNLSVVAPDVVREVAPYVDVVFDESGFTSYGTNDLTSAAWQREFDELEYLGSLGKAVDVNEIVDATSNAAVTPKEINWALANYLLVKGARTYTYIYANSTANTSPSGYGTFFDRPQYHVPIGRPQSQPFSSYGVEMRYYAGGLAIVNASSWQAFSVPLGQSYADMFGHRYTAVTLPPASGIVLLSAPWSPSAFGRPN